MIEREICGRIFYDDGRKTWVLGHPNNPWAKYVKEMLKGEDVIEDFP